MKDTETPYFYGTMDRYHDTDYGSVFHMKECGRVDSVAHFKYSHEGHDWATSCRDLCDMFYNFNRKYVCWALDEHSYCHMLKTRFMPRVSLFVHNQCDNETAMIPLELRHILDCVKEEIGYPEVVWPRVLLLPLFSSADVVSPDVADVIGREV